VENTLIRVGNETSARDNDSYGLTTLRARHVRIEADKRIRLKFRGKSGVDHAVTIEDRRLARTVKRCREQLAFDVVPETLQRSNLGRLEKGELVNLEASLRFGDTIGGHFVYGHVDACVMIIAKEAEGQGYRLWCGSPEPLTRLTVVNCYVAMDGRRVDKVLAGREPAGETAEAAAQ